MNDILSIVNIVIIFTPFFIISSIIQSIYILNQGAAQPSFKKILPSVITASVGYTILVISFFIIWLLLLAATATGIIIPFLILEFICFMYMGDYIRNQSTNSQVFFTKKQILFAKLIFILSIFSPYTIMMISIGFTIIGERFEDSSFAFMSWLMLSLIILTWVWFIFLAIVGYNIRKLNKSTILTKINKIATFVIWCIPFCMVALYVLVS